jgi:hypothetical protein
VNDASPSKLTREVRIRHWRGLLRKQYTDVSAKLEVVDGRVSLGDRSWRLEDITSAWLYPCGGESTLYIEARGAKLELVLGLDDARTVIAALHKDPSHTRARFEIAPSILWSFFALLLRVFLPGVAALAYATTDSIVAPIALLLVSILGIFVLGKRKVLAGSDGISIPKLGARRFVPYRWLDHAELAEEVSRGERWMNVILHHKDGEREQIPIGTDQSDPLNPELAGKRRRTASAMVEHANQAIAAERAREGERTSASLRRSKRSFDQWITDLRARSAGGYRDAHETLADEQLWNVLENVALTPAVRAAAAVALAPKLDDAGRGRIRVAAEATAAPHLRVAFDSAVEGKDKRLLETLRDLDESEGGVREQGR